MAYLNSDDLYLPGTLAKVASAFQDHPDVRVVYGNEYLINEKDEVIGERRLTGYIPFISKLGFLYGGFGIYQPASFWTRELYFAVGGIDTVFCHCMDNDLFTRFALGQANAINKGFEQSQGKIVGWLNSDDTYLTRNTIKQVVEEMKKHPEVDYLYGNRMLIDEDRNLVGLKYTCDFNREKFLIGRLGIYQESVFLKSSVIKKEKLDEAFHFCLDTEYWLRISKQYKLRYLKNLFACFRTHQTNKTKHNSENWKTERLRLNQRYGFQGIGSDGSQASQLINKFSRLLSGSYNGYVKLIPDLVRLTVMNSDDLAIDINTRKSRFFVCLLNSLLPTKKIILR